MSAPGFFAALLLATGPPDAVREQHTRMQLQHGVVARFRTVPFVEAAHEVRRCRILDWDGVCLIDGKPVFGTDWDIPRTVLQNGVILVGGREVALDVSCMYNPMLEEFGKRLQAREVEGGHVVSGRFSDAAGSYTAEWLIVEGASVRTSLRRSEL